MLLVWSILFGCYHLYFQTKPLLMRRSSVCSHGSKEWLCSYSTVRISYTLTTAVKTCLWENYIQTLRAFESAAYYWRGGFLYRFSSALCNMHLSCLLCYRDASIISFSSGGLLLQPLPQTMVYWGLTGGAESDSVSKPEGLRGPLTVSLVTLFHCYLRQSR